MALEIVLATLLHLLVFVYWLGGDLGVFYASTILTDNRANQQGRIAAAKVLAQVDMAPRTAMILTLPTGISLASFSGYLTLSPLVLVAIWLAGSFWLFLAWRIHLQHLPPTSLWRKADLLVRAALILGLLVAAFAANLPLFIALKLTILAVTICLGLMIRRALAPFGSAFGIMVATGPTPETDHIIAQSLNRSRPLVVCIWLLLLIAATIGIAKPT